MTERRNPDTIHPPIGAYSHQVEVPGPRRLLAIAGQVGRTVDGTVPDDPLEQTRLALENVRRNLDAAGMGVADAPASTFVYVAAPAAPEYRVEIEAWAAK